MQSFSKESLSDVENCSYDIQQLKHQVIEKNKLIQTLKKQLKTQNKHKISTTSETDLLRFIQFNIRNANLDGKDYPNTWSNRLPSIIQFFEQYGPDIVAIQELVVKSLNDLQTYLPQNYNILYASRQPSNDTGDENNIWNEMVSIVWDNTKLDLLTFGKFSLCDHPQTFPCKLEGYKTLKWYRTALWGLFDIKSCSKQLLFVSTHFHGHTEFDDGFDIHSKQFKVVETQINNLLIKYYNNSNNLPLIFVSADWNTGQYREWWKNVTDITNNNGYYMKWKDPIYSWMGNGNRWNVNHTYHRFNGSNYHGKNDDVILDWFLVDSYTMNVITVNEVHAVTDFTTTELGNIYLSDHYPIVMDISLQN